MRRLIRSRELRRALSRAVVLLVVYCIAFKSGGFNGTLAGTHYIVSCQSVQNSMAFRTYCNFLGFLSAGAIAYGVFEAFFGGADGDREANPEATQNLIVSLLVSDLPRDGRRLATVSRSVHGPRWKRMVVHCLSDVAVDLFYNRCVVPDITLLNSSLGYLGDNPCPTPLRLFGRQLRLQDDPGAPIRMDHQPPQAASLGQHAV